MRNIALKLMYNGMAYHGWQMQRTEASVQETLQRGLSMVCGERVRLTGVGRTDAGVHAERYVANFRTSSRIPIDRLPFAVNTHTPEDIVVREALEVADDFNAIGSCLKKEYTYRIYNSRIKNPFYVNRAYFYPKKLDEAVMDAAARAFEGTHDFRAVRSVGTETKTTVRTVHYCRVTRRGELLELKVCADGFLYNMVRAITGTVLYAAEGKLTAEDIPKILDSGDRTLAGPTVPPGGLYMTRLWYEDLRHLLLQLGHLPVGLLLGVREHLVPLGLCVGDHLGCHPLGRQQGGAHGVLGGPILLHLLRQHLQLGLQGGVVLIQGGIILRQRIQKLVHGGHAVAVVEAGCLGERLFGNFLRCKHDLSLRFTSLSGPYRYRPLFSSSSIRSPMRSTE